jgi:hypothetical protein
MEDLEPTAAWWGFRPPDRRRSIVDLIQGGTLDVELAALLWLLVGSRVPVVVAAGPPLTGKTTLLTALLDFLPPGVERILCDGVTGPGDAIERADPRRSVLLVPELSDHVPVYSWGADARAIVRSASSGIGIATTIHGERLEDVLEQLSSPPVSLSSDELSYLGVVIVMRAGRLGERLLRRVVAAHYVRPVARDVGGHVQRLPPAVLATWDAAHDSFEHFEWAIVDELAARVGLDVGEFEAERRRRAGYLAELVGAAGSRGVEARVTFDARPAIDAYALRVPG